MRHTRVAAVIALGGVVSLALSSCLFIPSLIEDVGPVNDRPVVDGPTGWEELPSCPSGPRDDFVWVDGIPSKAIGDAGIVADCGDTFIAPDGDSFVGIADYSVTETQLDELGVRLVAEGWELKWDDFAPVSSPGPRASVGARDYYTDGDERKLAVEIYYDGGDPISYTAYVDYHSPETRALK